MLHLFDSSGSVGAIEVFGLCQSWFCTWKLVLNQYIWLTKSPNDISHGTLADSFERQKTEKKNENKNNFINSNFNYFFL